jgi:hypothetical protein
LRALTSALRETMFFDSYGTSPLNHEVGYIKQRDRFLACFTRGWMSLILLAFHCLQG